ncbi:hypothetical protein G7Z17_g1663 [Cylindrodendrum hubeiense]|uniref:Nephrocystin 3-like N-terminal domain-containing protein n=1 Tax=Cylindrodendrum hubeiense TaxID=595255 RepID=A0A9P5LF84_9HYPO|nr:hypothetical protein G7Z17_g1663 [Cylindrodendrum hubeiense]
MAFEFDGTEFLGVAKLAQGLQYEFRGAPSHLKKLSDEVGLLDHALQGVEATFRQFELNEKQRYDFQNAVRSCHKDLQGVELWNSTWGWPKLSREDVHELVDQVAASTVMLNTLITEVSSSSPALDLTPDQYDPSRRQPSQDRHTIMDWISPLDYVSEHSDKARRIYHGTGHELLDSEKFATWTADEGRTLFCPGIPGAGKTMVSAIVIEELKNRFRNDPSVSIAHIYCNYKREDSQTIQHLLESLLRQLVSNLATIPENIRSMYNTNFHGKIRPRFDELIQSLHEAAAIFLLAEFHLKSLANEQSPESLLQALENLPTNFGTYNSVYEDLMRNVEAQSMDRSNLAINALHWTAYAQRPLTITELQHALAVEVDEKSGIIRLVSHTTQEYFDQLPWFRFRDAHIYIARVCAIYLSFKVFQGGKCYPSQLQERFQTNPLFEYSSNYWVEHARRGDHMSEDKVIKSFMQSAKAMEASCQGFSASLHNQSRFMFRFPENLTPLHAAACSCLSSDSYFRTTRMEVNVRDALNRTPLFYAALGGNNTCLEHLLRTQGDTEIVDKAGQTPMHVAINHGSLSTLEMLLDHGYGHINRKDNIGSTPLTLAAIQGHERAIRLLLGIQAETWDSPCLLEPSSLAWAGKNGHDEVVKLVLEASKVHANSKDGSGTTPLAVAARFGHVEVVEFFIQANRVDANSKDNCVSNCLALAARHGHDQVVKLLLGLPGVRSNSKDRHGSTPLSLAAKGGHEKVVKLLLESNSRHVNSRDKHGMSSLSLAAMGGHEEVVKLLLQAPRIDADSKCISNMTPLILAARNGHEDVFKLLLDTGAVQPRVAVQKNVDCVELLLDYGAKAHSIDSWEDIPVDDAKMRAIIAEIRSKLS